MDLEKALSPVKVDVFADLPTFHIFNIGKVVRKLDDVITIRQEPQGNEIDISVDKIVGIYPAKEELKIGLDNFIDDIIIKSGVEKEKLDIDRLISNPNVMDSYIETMKEQPKSYDIALSIFTDKLISRVKDIDKFLLSFRKEILPTEIEEYYDKIFEFLKEKKEDYKVELKEALKPSIERAILERIEVKDFLTDEIKKLISDYKVKKELTKEQKLLSLKAGDLVDIEVERFGRLEGVKVIKWDKRVIRGKPIVVLSLDLGTGGSFEVTFEEIKSIDILPKEVKEEVPKEEIPKVEIPKVEKVEEKIPISEEVVPRVEKVEEVEMPKVKPKEKILSSIVFDLNKIKDVIRTFYKIRTNNALWFKDNVGYIEIKDGFVKLKTDIKEDKYLYDFKKNKILVRKPDEEELYKVENSIVYYTEYIGKIEEKLEKVGTLSYSDLITILETFPFLSETKVRFDSIFLEVKDKIANVIATDGHRLIRINMPLNLADGEYFIWEPKYLYKFISKNPLESYDIYYYKDKKEDKEFLKISGNSYEIVLEKILGIFPDWRKATSEYNVEYLIKREDFEKFIKEIKDVAIEDIWKQVPINFIFKEKEIEVIYKHPETKEEYKISIPVVKRVVPSFNPFVNKLKSEVKKTVDIVVMPISSEEKWEGILVDYSFLKDILSYIKGDIYFSFVDKEKPLYFSDLPFDKFEVEVKEKKEVGAIEKKEEIIPTEKSEYVNPDLEKIKDIEFSLTEKEILLVIDKFIDNFYILLAMPVKEKGKIKTKIEKRVLGFSPTELYDKEFYDNWISYLKEHFYYYLNNEVKRTEKRGLRARRPQTIDELYKKYSKKYFDRFNVEFLKKILLREIKEEELEEKDREIYREVMEDIMFFIGAVNKRFAYSFNKERAGTTETFEEIEEKRKESEITDGMTPQEKWEIKEDLINHIIELASRENIIKDKEEASFLNDIFKELFSPFKKDEVFSNAFYVVLRRKYAWLKGLSNEEIGKRINILIRKIFKILVDKFKKNFEKDLSRMINVLRDLFSEEEFSKHLKSFKKADREILKLLYEGKEDKALRLKSAEEIENILQNFLMKVGDKALLEKIIENLGLPESMPELLIKFLEKFGEDSDSILNLYSGISPEMIIKGFLGLFDFSKKVYEKIGLKTIGERIHPLRSITPKIWLNIWNVIRFYYEGIEEKREETFRQLFDILKPFLRLKKELKRVMAFGLLEVEREFKEPLELDIYVNEVIKKIETIRKLKEDERRALEEAIKSYHNWVESVKDMLAEALAKREYNEILLGNLYDVKEFERRVEKYKEFVRNALSVANYVPHAFPVKPYMVVYGNKVEFFNLLSDAIKRQQEVGGELVFLKHTRPKVDLRELVDFLYLIDTFFGYDRMVNTGRGSLLTTLLEDSIPELREIKEIKKDIITQILNHFAHRSNFSGFEEYTIKNFDVVLLNYSLRLSNLISNIIYSASLYETIVKRDLSHRPQDYELAMEIFDWYRSFKPNRAVGVFKVFAYTMALGLKLSFGVINSFQKINTLLYLIRIGRNVKEFANALRLEGVFYQKFLTNFWQEYLKFVKESWTGKGIKELMVLVDDVYRKTFRDLGLKDYEVEILMRCYEKGYLRSEKPREYLEKKNFLNYLYNLPQDIAFIFADISERSNRLNAILSFIPFAVEVITKKYKMGRFEDVLEIHKDKIDLIYDEITSIIKTGIDRTQYNYSLYNRIPLAHNDIISVFFIFWHFFTNQINFLGSLFKPPKEFLENLPPEIQEEFLKKSTFFNRILPLLIFLTWAIIWGGIFSLLLPFEAIFYLLYFLGRALGMDIKVPFFRKFLAQKILEAKDNPILKLAYFGVFGEFISPYIFAMPSIFSIYFLDFIDTIRRGISNFRRVDMTFLEKVFGIMPPHIQRLFKGLKIRREISEQQFKTLINILPINSKDRLLLMDIYYTYNYNQPTEIEKILARIGFSTRYTFEQYVLRDLFEKYYDYYNNIKNYYNRELGRRLVEGKEVKDVFKNMIDKGVPLRFEIINNEIQRKVMEKIKEKGGLWQK
ncbi:MAG: hypothetical protein NZ608_06950 [candidate division WOR-3 bacterium]|nr:hypothetical protein [candidate division WOR-3 bacterium]